MEPVRFEQSNTLLRPSGEQYSGNVISVSSLPAWTDGEQCVTCWRMSLKERISALICGRVWLAVLSGETQPPVHIEVGRRYFRV